MTDVVQQHLEAIRALCHEYNVTQPEIFGSSVRDDFNAAHSDIDLLVEFAPGTDLGPWLARFTELRERLEVLLGRKVDLGMASGLQNPYFIRSIAQDRQVLYAA